MCVLQNNPLDRLREGEFESITKRQIALLGTSAPDLVQQNAHCFAVLAEANLTGAAVASSADILSALFSVLDPERALPTVCRSAAAQALGIATASSIGAATLRRLVPDALVARLTSWLVPPPAAFESLFLNAFM